MYKMFIIYMHLFQFNMFNLICVGVQISSIRFFVHLFQNKMNEQNNSNIVHRCLLFPSFQAIFEFHLEKMTRLWKRSNFGANFLRKK